MKILLTILLAVYLTGCTNEELERAAKEHKEKSMREIVERQRQQYEWEIDVEARRQIDIENRKAEIRSGKADVEEWRIHLIDEESKWVEPTQANH